MIKNIIFDFGGVLLDLDYSRTADALSRVLDIQMTWESIPKRINRHLIDYEKGQISTEGFIWNLQRLAHGKTPHPNAIIKAWNAMLLGWNPVRFSFLEQLKKKYRVMLLSNTNALHLDWVRRDLKNNHGIENFDDRFFAQTFYSHELGMRKPDMEIYDTVTKKAGVLPSETLFVDDNSQNVSQAQKAGWHAICHNPENEIIEIFNQYMEKASYSAMK